MDLAVHVENQEIREFILSEVTWMPAFEMFLDRYEDCKPKPIRHVLNSLMNNFTKIAPEVDRYSIESSMIPMLLSNIILCEPRSRFKASLVSLEWLIRKNAFLTIELVERIESWLLQNNHAWSPLLEAHFIKMNISLDLFQKKEARLDISRDDLQYYAMQIFITALILGAIDQENFPSAGSMLSCICQKLKAEPITNKILYSNPHSACPFWLISVRYITLRNLAVLDSMSNHILQPLFKTEPSGFQSFIRTLPLEALQFGSETASQGDLILLFSVLKVAKELGILHEDGESSH